LASALQDYLASVTRNIIGEGHSATYYGQGSVILDAAGNRTGVTDLQTTEAFANYIALRGAENPVWDKLMRFLAPEATREMDKIVRQIDRGGQP
jgi:hypothetical protein